MSKKYSENKYEKYENYNAINVNKISDIPYNYNGIMGVPISILEKYIIDEYDIIWQASGNTRANCPREILKELGYIPHKDDKGGAGIVNGKRVYSRIFIKKKINKIN